MELLIYMGKNWYQLCYDINLFVPINLTWQFQVISTCFSAQHALCVSTKMLCRKTSNFILLFAHMIILSLAYD